MTKPPLAKTIASLLSIAVLTPTLALPRPSFAVSAETAAARELARRSDYMVRGEAAIETGSRAYKDKDYETAVQQYKLAADVVPNSPNSKILYGKALDGFCNASIKLAEQRITEGRYADAEALCKTVLDDQYNPTYKAAVVLLRRLETPGYYNRTIGPKFRGTVEEVKKMFIDAQGFYDTGRYELAFKRTEQILNLDPYNIAARKMQEKINFQRDNFALASADAHRAKAIWETDRAWADPVRKFNVTGPTGTIGDGIDTSGTAKINAKLASIILPKLEFKDATIREAVEFLKKKSADLDTRETEPSKRGVNIVLKLENSGGSGFTPPPEATPAPAGIPGLLDAPAPAAVAVAAPSGNPGEQRITVSLSNIPLIEALKYVTGLANLKFKVEPYAVSIVPQGVDITVLNTKEFKVRPGFINRVAGGGGDGGGNGLAPTAPADATKGGSSIAGRMDAKDFLIASGVTFPQGATATYIPTSSRLVVRNTQENLDLIDILIQAGDSIASQVEIEAKFVEITQNNTKELSFDWLLGQANIPGGSKDGIFVGGGTSGNTPKIDQADYPFPINNGAYTSYPVTGANRSGGLAISQNAIDSLLFGTAGASKLAPAIAGIAGIMTDPSFQLVIRALNQKKGVDLLSAPKVTTKSGQKAIIEIIREFRYPTEFDPPQIPQNFGGGGGGNNGGTTQINSFPVTPTTPTTFETRNTGVTLEVEPVVGPDSYTIELSLVPQVVEFEGFINYGSPITTASPAFSAAGIQIGSTQTVITPNVINQPIFSTRKVTTSVSIFDGQTVLIGGLIREDVQKIEDKTPLLGDIPLIGRLFRSNVDQHLKRHLVIFVSARLINPAGEPVRLDEEKEEEVETLPLMEAETTFNMKEVMPLMPK